MRMDQVYVAKLENIDESVRRQVVSGDTVRLVLYVDVVMVKVDRLKMRLGETRSAKLLTHLRMGGEARGTFEETLKDPMIVWSPKADPHEWGAEKVGPA